MKSITRKMAFDRFQLLFNSPTPPIISAFSKCQTMSDALLISGVVLSLTGHSSQ